jgi:tRNA 2-thiouridine synthesizing protein A
MTTQTHTLDARGLNCPLPILRTRKAIAKIEAGEVLEVTSSDPGSVKDISSFCSQTGHELITSDEDSGDFIFTIRKKQ